MSIFSGVKDNWKKSEAAAVVQALLEVQKRRGIFSGDESMVANQMVAAVWKQKPHFFNGIDRPRPHKMTIAAIALAIFANDHPPENLYRDAALMSLADILSHIGSNPEIYQFNYVDESLLESSAGLLAKYGQELGL